MIGDAVEKEASTKYTIPSIEEEEEQYTKVIKVNLNHKISSVTDTKSYSNFIEYDPDAVSSKAVVVKWSGEK